MIIVNDISYSFRDALNNAQCGKCESKLFWEAAFDSNGTNYHSECCGLKYVLFPATVSVAIET